MPVRSKGIESKVGEDRPIDLDRAAQPASRLIDEPVFIVTDPHSAKRAFGEIKDLVPL